MSLAEPLRRWQELPGAVRGGAPGFERLIDACQSLAVSVSSGSLVAGCNMARRRAFETMADRGFRTAFLGVHMQKNDDPGYCRDDVFAIDDWR